MATLFLNNLTTLPGLAPGANLIAMDKIELKDALGLLFEKFENDKKVVMQKFCDSNNPHAVGDKVTDHIGTIAIERILYSLPSTLTDLPCCVYFGTEINKDGKPNKKGKKRQVWQRNLVS